MLFQGQLRGFLVMKGNTIIPKEVDHWTYESGLPMYACPHCNIIVNKSYMTCTGCDKIIDWSRTGKEVKE